jgi:hypothetical protein
MAGKIIWRALKLRSSICLLWQAQCVAADPLIQSISPSFNEICVARKYVCARRRHRGRKYAAHQPTNQPTKQAVLELLAMVICHSNNSRGCEKVCFFACSLVHSRLFAAAAFIRPPANRQRLSGFLQL